MISTSDGYSSHNMSVAPDHGNKIDDGALTTHSVAVDGPPFDDDETFNDSFAMPRSPDLVSLSSSSEDETIDKQTVILPIYGKDFGTGSGGSSSAVTGKKHHLPQTRGRSVQHGGLNCFVRRAQLQRGGRMEQGI